MRFLVLIFLSLFLLNLLSTHYAFAEEQEKIKLAVFGFNFSDEGNLNFSPEKSLKDDFEKLLRDDSYFSLVENQNESKGFITPEMIIDFGNKSEADAVITGTISKYNEEFLLNLKLVDTIQSRTLYSQDFFCGSDHFEKISTEYLETLEKIFRKNPNLLNIYQIGSGNSRIKVKSVPEKALISINGQELGKTPLFIKGVEPVQNLLEAWQTENIFIKNLSFSGDKNEVFFLQIGKQKYNNSVITLKDLNVYEQDFELYSQENRTNERSFSRDKNFVLDLQTEPNGVEVFLDQKFVGISPLKIKDIGEGKHQLKLKPQKVFVFRELVNSYENKNATVNFNLYKIGRVLISSKPDKAEVIVNEKKIGLTPKSFELPIGRHQLLLKKDGYDNQLYSLKISEGDVTELIAELPSLKNKDTGIGFLPTAVTDNVLSLSFSGLSFGQYTFADLNKSPAGLFFSEINYGFPDVLQAGIFNFGLQAGAFLQKTATLSGQSFPWAYGAGGKIQLLKENENIPVSIALGGYYHNSPRPQENFSAYLSASRSFGDFSFHLGLQSRAINFNINYHKFYRLKLGISALLNFNLLNQSEKETISPLIGFSAGYNFF